MLRSFDINHKKPSGCLSTPTPINKESLVSSILRSPFFTDIYNFVLFLHSFFDLKINNILIYFLILTFIIACNNVDVLFFPNNEYNLRKLNPASTDCQEWKPDRDAGENIPFGHQLLILVNWLVSQTKPLCHHKSTISGYKTRSWSPRTLFLTIIPS